MIDAEAFRKAFRKAVLLRPGFHPILRIFPWLFIDFRIFTGARRIVNAWFSKLLTTLQYMHEREIKVVLKRMGNIDG